MATEHQSHKKLKMSKITKYALVLAIAAVVFSMYFATSGNVGKFTVGGGKSGRYYSNYATPFAVDAWGPEGWNGCTKQSGGQAMADAFCRCKTGKSYPANDCMVESHSNRWTWSVSYPTCNLGKGTYTYNGNGVSYIRCRI